MRRSCVPVVPTYNFSPESKHFFVIFSNIDRVVHVTALVCSTVEFPKSQKSELGPSGNRLAHSRDAAQ